MDAGTAAQQREEQHKEGCRHQRAADDALEHNVVSLQDEGIRGAGKQRVGWTKASSGADKV